MILVDADVLGRGRTGEETYVANLLRELPAAAPDLRFAAVTRHPELVPEGVEAVPLPARFQEVRMALVASAASPAPRAARSPTFSTRCRSGTAAGASSRSTTSISSGTRA